MVLILVQAVGQGIQIVAASDFSHHGTNTGFPPHLEAEASGRGLVLNELAMPAVFSLELHNGVGSCSRTREKVEDSVVGRTPRLDQLIDQF